MNIILIGASGFIGTNLVIRLSKNKDNQITVVGHNRQHFVDIENSHLPNVFFVESALAPDMNYEMLLEGQDIVYHLISSTVPSTCNHAIVQELTSNVLLSANLLDACIKQKIKKIVFFSSGGTVYGRTTAYPISEEAPLDPVTSYGVQKLTIEKLIFLYNYLYGLDYRIIRLSNPYGPYQRPNGVLGAVTTFTYKALRGEEIFVYGDGSVVRDFIYIDDAVDGVLKIVDGSSDHRIFNLGCGYGTSIGQVLNTVQDVLNVKLKVTYLESRKVDVPVNVLDIRRFEDAFGPLNPTSLEEGIKKTAQFMRLYYSIL